MIFKHARLFVNGAFHLGDLEITGTTITAIGEQLCGDEELDCSGRMLLPGLVEIHSHGCVGEDFSTSDGEGVEKMRRYYLENGITTVLATTMTEEFSRYRRAMTVIREAMQQESRGARLVGINMEGPFLSPQKKGAHDERYLLLPSVDFLEELDALSGRAICLVDFAPELPGADELVAHCRGKKTLSLAHTDCGYDRAMAMFHSGANHVTHLFNAMNDPKHREPGIVGAVCDADGVFAELICDGIHNHPSIVRMMFAACPEKIVLISDSMSACGMPDGQYELGGLAVTVQNGKATLADGTIAGSAVCLTECMRRAISFGVAPEQAILSATKYPAESVGLTDVGELAVGKRADLVLMNDAWEVEQCWLGGERLV